MTEKLLAWREENVIAYVMILEGRHGGPLLAMSSDKNDVVKEALRQTQGLLAAGLGEEAQIVLDGLRKRIENWDGETDIYKQGFSCQLDDGYVLVKTGGISLRKVEYT